MMTAIGAALMATGAGCLMASHFQLSELQFELNKRLPEGRKFEPLFWWFGTYVRLRELQRAVLPQSPRPKKALRFAYIGFALFFTGVGMLWLGSHS